VYFPQGYTAALNQAPGTQIGSVDATAQSVADPNIIVPLENGAIVVGDPTQPAIVAGAAQCLGQNPPPLNGVWLLRLTNPLNPAAPINLPAYLTVGLSGPEGDLGQAKMTVCLPAPGAGALPAKVFGAVLRLQNFTNPAAAGSYTWVSYFTPYVGTTPNPAGTVESQSVDTIGIRANLRAGGYNRRTKRVSVGGSVSAGGSGQAAIVSILLNGKRVARVRTNANGVYRASIRIRKKGLNVIRATAANTPRTLTSCTPSIPALVPTCVSTTLPAFSVASNAARVRVRRL
jgi:hypothetical protein